MKSLPIRFGLQANYLVHKVAENLNGYNYYGFVANDGSVIVQRMSVAGTEILYANGGTNLTTAWTAKETLTYQTIDALLA
jgi:hypothetical protein